MGRKLPFSAHKQEVSVFPVLLCASGMEILYGIPVFIKQEPGGKQELTRKEMKTNPFSINLGPIMQQFYIHLVLLNSVGKT